VTIPQDKARGREEEAQQARSKKGEEREDEGNPNPRQKSHHGETGPGEGRKPTIKLWC
jgi:hypothetical protein